ncbi:hypothetical protein VTJ49DRAFT_6899 [Mycothermus thermophilus]|uniref:NADAR domain-containing protein n=1 Tax=Humicola insolens TaxID=85995 RepID=A0ABR3VI98_HUMIN
MAPKSSSKRQHRVSKRKPTKTKMSTQVSQPEASGSSSSPVYFWRDADPLTGYLSQWYPCAFTDDEDPSIVYRTAEHYMMYHKALLFSDTATAQEILTANQHPRKVKELGRTVGNFSEETWNAHREEIVRKGNLLKFTRPANPDDGTWTVAAAGGKNLRELLLETGDREIVEASPYDRIWGIGFVAGKAEGERERWGLNLLGKALMEVRAELRDQGEKGEKAEK